MNTATSRAVRFRHRRGPRGSRLLVAAPLVGLAAAMMVRSTGVRGFEAELCAWVLHAVSGTTTMAMPKYRQFLWNIGTPHPYGIWITADCSSAFSVGPLLVLAAASVCSQRFASSRVLMATVVAAAVLFTVNVLRIVGIALATSAWGQQTGYGWTHTVAGSLVTILGAMTALALFAWILFGGRPRLEQAAIPA